MKYFKAYKQDGAIGFEVTKEVARETLEGYWKEEAMIDYYIYGGFAMANRNYNVTDFRKKVYI